MLFQLECCSSWSTIPVGVLFQLEHYSSWSAIPAGVLFQLECRSSCGALFQLENCILAGEIFHSWSAIPPGVLFHLERCSSWSTIPALRNQLQETHDTAKHFMQDTYPDSSHSIMLAQCYITTTMASPICSLHVTLTGLEGVGVVLESVGAVWRVLELFGVCWSCLEDLEWC